MKHSLKSLRRLAVALITFGTLVGNANAASVILGPTSTAVSITDPGAYAHGQLIDQSGLSASYISGVTDFTSFTSSTQAD